MMLLGAIVGGSSIEERKRCAKEVSLRNVSGLHNLYLNYTLMMRSNVISI